MRIVPLAAAALLAGCAHLTGPTPPPSEIAVSEDGATVTAGGETWSAPRDAAFYQRGDVLHVVSTVAGRAFDVAVSLGADGRLAWPAEAPFVARGGELHPRAEGAPPEVALLIETGQLHPHDDHYHLTHRFEDEDWQAIYRAREEGSPLPPMRRQVAATVLAMLLDQRIPGTPPEATEAAVRRARSVIAKVRRAVAGDVGARSIEAIMASDFEIREDGRSLEIAGQLYRAGDGLRFTYCGGHFHVEDAAGRWAQPVELGAAGNGPFTWPRSIFFDVRPDATVVERPASTRWRQLADSGQIRFVRDHWHVTESYANPRLQRILEAVADDRLAEPLRDKARGLAMDVLRLRLDVGSEAEFTARLDAVDQVIDQAGAELEKAARTAPRGKR